MKQNLIYLAILLFAITVQSCDDPLNDAYSIDSASVSTAALADEQYSLLEDDYDWIAQNEDLGTATSRANLASYSNFYQASSTSGNYWSSAAITEALSAVMTANFPNATPGATYLVNYEFYDFNGGGIGSQLLVVGENGVFTAAAQEEYMLVESDYNWIAQNANLGTAASRANLGNFNNFYRADNNSQNYWSTTAIAEAIAERMTVNFPDAVPGTAYLVGYVFYDFQGGGTGTQLLVVAEDGTFIFDESGASETDNTSAGSRGFPDDSGSDVPPTSGDNSNMLLGNPSGAQFSTIFPNNYLLDLSYYSLAYDNDRAIPNWVSWHLDASTTVSNTSRLDNFAAFNALPSGWYQAQSTSYSGSGFDRGHNCPSADRLSSAEANSSTFLMVNMIPQAPNNNQQVWNNFEMYLRTLVNQGNEIYVIMGSYGRGGTGSNGTASTIDNGNITVPSQVWKVAVILPAGNNDIARIEAGQASIIAINTPNVNNLSSNWEDHVVTVRSIEIATGYNLLSEIAQDVQDDIENELNNAA